MGLLERSYNVNIQIYQNTFMDGTVVCIYSQPISLAKYALFLLTLNSGWYEHTLFLHLRIPLEMELEALSTDGRVAKVLVFGKSIT
jgi:hypothetical protein